jgi:Uncharacterised nucleotidyltransferase/BON domain
VPEGENEKLTHERMERVLLRAVDALEAEGIPYALMGGLASAAIGRSRHTHDIDVFVTPEQADVALETLERDGFRIERTDPEWIFKAFWGETMVDVIFVSKGDIVFDDAARAHLRPVEILGRPVLALSAEDMLVIKAATNAEHVPRHWHDGLGILETNQIDWPYLVERARPHASRVASLLLYALSDGLELPAEPVRELFETAMCAVPTEARTEAEHHLAARLRQALATDPRVNELHVSVLVHEGDVVVRGQVPTEARREAIATVLGELVGAGHVRNEVEVA